MTGGLNSRVVYAPAHFANVEVSPLPVDYRFTDVEREPVPMAEPSGITNLAQAPGVAAGRDTVIARLVLECRRAVTVRIRSELILSDPAYCEQYAHG